MEIINMNSIQASRIINNFIANLQLNNDFIIKIKNELKQNNNQNKKLKELENDNIALEILEYHIKELQQQYPDIQFYINKSRDKLKLKFLKKYFFAFAQNEISDNMNFSIGDKVNNLSFSSQDVDYRSAPVVVYRQFSDDKKSYEDKVWIGQNGQHHDQLLTQSDFIDHATDENGNYKIACLYLYQDDIIYISNQDENSYPNTDILVQILKEKFPRPIQGIFSVFYPQIGNDEGRITTRLAKKLY